MVGCTDRGITAAGLHSLSRHKLGVFWMPARGFRTGAEIWISQTISVP